MQNKNQPSERKFITLIIINKLKCIVLVDGFYSVIVWRESCETTSTEFVVWPPPCTGGNEARGVSVKSSIVNTARSV
jgi:hypothetical protein